MSRRPPNYAYNVGISASVVCAKLPCKSELRLKASWACPGLLRIGQGEKEDGDGAEGVLSA